MYDGPLKVPNKRAKKDPLAPKRAMSAFLHFSQSMRPRLRDTYPDAKNMDMSKMLGQVSFRGGRQTGGGGGKGVLVGVQGFRCDDNWVVHCVLRYGGDAATEVYEYGEVYFWLVQFVQVIVGGIL